RAAYRELDAIVNQIIDEWSAAATQRLKPDDDADAVAEYCAAQQLEQIHARRLARRAAVQQAGGRSRPDLRPAPMMRACLTLGSAAAWDSDISACRRELEAQKLI